MTALSTSSTNDVNTAKPAYEVSIVSSNINTASPQVSIASFSDNKQWILKWQFFVSMRAKRNQDNTRKKGNNEDTSSKAMLAIDGVGFDWSDMAKKQVQTNMALMAFSDSELNQTEFTAATYKRGLATIEEQLITYRKNEKRGHEFKNEKFDKASKDLDKLLGSQITDKSKKGLGYSAVPPPHPLIYNRPNKLDLSYSGLDEFKEPEFKGYGPENSKQESNVVCEKESDNSKENSDESLVKEQVSQDKSSFVESSPNVDKETVFPANKKVEFTKPKNHEKPVKKSVRNMSPKAVLLKTGLTPLNTVRPVNTAHPKIAVHSAKLKTHFLKQEQSTTKRPFYKQTTLTRRSVHEAKRHYYTGRHNAVNTARSYTGQVNVVRVKRVNAVKSSAYWVWRPTKSNGASLAFKRHNYIDARGRSKANHNMMINDLLTVDAQGT
ncbi:hypothetical protein Tco_0681643 [Tanacetum coccineum]|uniref:Uncharacterized protein n=1 Tax=Tanacetum coccineum TaxID=301880 RepID=A0ABQ4XP68_9ASTR